MSTKLIGTILGNVQSYYQKIPDTVDPKKFTIGPMFPGFPRVQFPNDARPSNNYGAVSMQDHASNSVNTIECFVAFDFPETNVHVENGAVFSFPHAGSMVRYAGPSAPLDKRWPYADNSIIIELVDIGSLLDTADRRETKHGQMIGATLDPTDEDQIDLAWPYGVRGQRVNARCMPFDIPSHGNYVFRLSSMLQLGEDLAWLGKESWLQRIELDGITLEYDYTPLNVVPVPDLEEIAFARRMLANPDLMEFFRWAEANPDQVPLLKQFMI